MITLLLHQLIAGSTCRGYGILFLIRNKKLSLSVIGTFQWVTMTKRRYSNNVLTFKLGDGVRRKNVISSALSNTDAKQFEAKNAERK